MNYLLCAIDLFSKYAWVVPLKDKRGISIINAFQKLISEGKEAESKRRRKWVDQIGELYNKLFKRFLKTNNIERYSTYNEGKSVLAERFIRALKTRFLSTWQLFQRMFILIC